MATFDPNGVGISNGNIFGFPVTQEEASIVLFGIPWDVTASYGKGTANAPEAILEASTQLDFYHPKLENAFQTKVYLEPINAAWKKRNDELLPEVTAYINYLEEGGKVEDSSSFSSFLDETNQIHLALKNEYKAKSLQNLEQNKIVGFIGGEHSVPLALIEALAEKSTFGILQIDAHADLRDTYEGFHQSHASVMFNAIQLDSVSHLVQVGIRDVAQVEIDLINTNSKIATFFDWEIKEKAFAGVTWKKQVEQIVNALPEKVYISFDIDGLRPELCPNTGTPVAGGFSLEEVVYLIFEVVNAGKEIVGFDLNEVGVANNTDWDANVGARALWNLVCAVELSRRKNG
ncbi:MAG: agmatinase family protein [Lishizhenia sp.]